MTQFAEKNGLKIVKKKFCRTKKKIFLKNFWLKNLKFFLSLFGKYS